MIESFAGGGSVRFFKGQKIDAGQILQYEKTQPWTVMVALKIYEKPDEAAVIFSNMDQPPFSGYEFWINGLGYLNVRLIEDYTEKYIDVQGKTDLADNKWHYVAATYDGSGKAAGIKLYLDGKPENVEVVKDTLTGSIVDSKPNSFVIGNQKDFKHYFYVRGYMDEFTFSNIERTSDYIAQYSTSQNLPPIDSNTQLYYHFDKKEGIVTEDSSPHKNNAELSHITIRSYVYNSSPVLGKFIDIASASSSWIRFKTREFTRIIANKIK